MGTPRPSISRPHPHPPKGNASPNMTIPAYDRGMTRPARAAVPRTRLASPPACSAPQRTQYYDPPPLIDWLWVESQIGLNQSQSQL